MQSVDGGHRQNTWFARVKTIEYYDVEQQNDDESSSTAPTHNKDTLSLDRVMLECQGNCHDLSMTLKRSEHDHGKASEVLMLIKIPNDKSRVGLKILQRQFRLSITVESVISLRSTTRHWNIELESSQDEDFDRARAMLRRLTNVTEDMPTGWLTHREVVTTSAINLGEYDAAAHTWKVDIGNITHVSASLSRRLHRLIGCLFLP